MASDCSRSAMVILRGPSGRILFIRRSISCPKYPLHWGVPGGYAEKREKYEDCAVRELFEETGLSLNPQDLSRLGQYEEGTMQTAIFRADVQHFVPLFSDGEHDAFTWALFQDAPYPTVPGLLKAIFLSGGAE